MPARLTGPASVRYRCVRRPGGDAEVVRASERRARKGWTPVVRGRPGRDDHRSGCVGGAKRHAGPCPDRERLYRRAADAGKVTGPAAASNHQAGNSVCRPQSRLAAEDAVSSPPRTASINPNDAGTRTEASTPTCRHAITSSRSSPATMTGRGPSRQRRGTSRSRRCSIRRPGSPSSAWSRRSWQWRASGISTFGRSGSDSRSCSESARA